MEEFTQDNPDDLKNVESALELCKQLRIIL